MVSWANLTSSTEHLQWVAQSSWSCWLREKLGTGGSLALGAGCATDCAKPSVWSATFSSGSCLLHQLNPHLQDAPAAQQAAFPLLGAQGAPKPWDKGQTQVLSASSQNGNAWIKKGKAANLGASELTAALERCFWCTRLSNGDTSRVFWGISGYFYKLGLNQAAELNPALALCH